MSNEASPSYPKSAMIAALPEYRGFLIALSRHLKRRGTQIHWYVSTQQERAYYADGFGDLFASINTVRRLHKTALEPIPDQTDVVATARANERRLGITYNQIIMSNRHLGRGFALGGFGHPRSTFSEFSTYPSILHAVNESIAYWEGEMDRVKPDVIIHCGKVAAVIARHCGIPYRTLVQSNYRNYHFWGVNEFHEHPMFEENFKAPRDGGEAITIQEPYDTHMQILGRWTKQLTLGGTLKDLALLVARRIYWRLKRYEKARGYFVSEELKLLWRRYVRLRELNKLTHPLSSLDGTPFVYYPLHIEPEASVQLMSPEYFYQISAIAGLARDLPAGHVLAVKENLGGVGRRPRDFYRQISEFKNVILIDAFEYGLNCAARSAAVAIITGTGGFEGAVMGKPVVIFGRHVTYGFLDHCLIVTEETQIAPFLSGVLSSGFNGGQARRDGTRFLQAVVDASFDLGEFNVTKPDDAKLEIATAAAENLVRHLHLRDPQAPPIPRAAAMSPATARD